MPSGYQWRGAENRRQLEVDERLIALRAQLAAEQDGPGPEWRNEVAAEEIAPPVPLPLAPEPPALRAVPDPPAVPERCRDCGYLTSARGHHIQCGDA